MTIPEFNEWCNTNIEIEIIKLKKKYPKCRKHIQEDISDYYIHIMDRIDDVQCPRKYLYQFIYNRYHRYFTDLKKRNMFSAMKQLTITTTDDLTVLNPNTPDEVYDESIQYRLQDMTKMIISRMPLYDQRLYELYYVEGQTIMQIAEYIGLSHNGIHKQLVKLRKHVKVEIESRTKDIDY